MCLEIYFIMKVNKIFIIVAVSILILHFPLMVYSKSTNIRTVFPYLADILDSYCSYYLTGPNNLKELEEFTDDMYEIFLGGSKSLISIENPNAKTDRELVMFRDSFGFRE